MRLTDTKIREATLIEGRRYRVLGDGRGGYGLRLVIQRGKSGAITKSFTQRLSVDGKQTDIGIGNYPLIGLDDARAIAILNARQVRLSRPSALDRMLAPTLAIAPAPAAPAPVLAIAPSDDMPTFGEAYERNIQLRLTAWQTNARGRSSSEMQWRSKYKNYLAGALGDMPVNEITSRTMQEILEPLWTAKPSVAEDICSYANHVFEWAQGMEYINSNPVIKAKKALGGKPRKNGRIHHEAIAHVSASQFYAGISAVSGMATAKNALRFLILTAARKEEVLAAKWGEVNFQAQTWTIPGGRGGRMKSGIDHVVPLPQVAIDILHDCMRDTLKPDAYIFSTARKGGEFGGKKIASGTLNGLVNRVNAEIGLSAVPHGFRSTFRDWAAEMTDVPREISEFALAHVEGSMAELAYRRSDFLEKRRELMDAWAAYIC